MEWHDLFSHDDLRGKVILPYESLLSSFELRHLIHWVTGYSYKNVIIGYFTHFSFELNFPLCVVLLLLFRFTKVHPILSKYLYSLIYWMLWIYLTILPLFLFISCLVTYSSLVSTLQVTFATILYTYACFS